MEPGDFLGLRYEPVAPLDGDRVQRVRDRLASSVEAILKRAPAASAELRALEREGSRLVGLLHPGIRALRGAGRTSRGDGVLLLEHVEGVDLGAHLASKPDDATRCAVSLLRVLLHLHERGLAHGDLKPGNVLVDRDCRLRLIDLGLSGRLGDAPAGGTRAFLAPELERGWPLTVAGDLYAFGQTLRLACGDSLTDPLGELVASCLAAAPEDRPASAAAALARLGAAPRPLDRAGRLPAAGRAAVDAAVRQVIARMEGGTVAVEGQPGSGRSRLVDDLRRSFAAEGRGLVDLDLAAGGPGLVGLGRLLGVAGLDGGLAEAAANAVAAAGAEGLAVVVDDADLAGEDLRLALPVVARALSASRKGALVLVGVDPTLAAEIEEAGGGRVSLSLLREEAVASLLAEAGARGDPELAAALARGSAGRAGVVARLVERLLDEPELDPREVEDRAGSLVRGTAAEPEPEPASPAEALAFARAALEGGAALRAVRGLRAGLPGLEAEPRGDPEAAVLLARALAMAGRMDEAAGLIERLGEAAPAPARLERLRLLERLGRYDACRAAAPPFLEIAEVAARAAVIAANAALEAGARDEAAAAVEAGLQASRDDVERLDLLLARSDLSLRSGDPGLALEQADEAIRGAEALSPPDPRRLARALSRRAAAHALSGDPILARSDYAAALEAARRTGDILGLPPFVMNLATAEHGAGELGAAIARYEEAARLGGRLGRRATAAAALTNLAGLLASVGAAEDARRTLASAREAARAAGSAIYDAQADLIAAELEGRVDPAEGAALARAARDRFACCGADRQALEAELLEAELRAEAGSAEAGEALCRDRRAALEEAGLGPRASLLRARIALASGALDSARVEGEAAAAGGAAGGDRDLEAAALTLLATLHERLGTGGAAPLVSRAREARAAVAARLPPGLRERFLADPRRSPPPQDEPRDEAEGPRPPGLGDGGRRLIALVRRTLLEGDERRLLEAAVDEAVELTRAERVFLLRKGGGRAAGRSEVVVARNLDGESIRKRKGSFSRSVADQVVASGEAVLTAMAAEDPRLREARSVLDLGLRSILCVPVRSPSGVTGALYLDHRFRQGRFGEAELELVQALADVIGLALENARLHREARGREEALALARDSLRQENLLRAAEMARLAERLARAEPAEAEDGSGIVGRSPALARALELARRVAPSDLPVLIEGESGTGKELVARYVHDRSLRAAGPFLAINCGAIPEPLLESELFGHVRGAFTGASHDHPGLLRSAASGTLLLDEIGEMPLGMQTRLLRALQEQEVRPVGSTASLPLDVRVLAATNRRLEGEVEAGRFRKDLFYRLVGVRLEVPPLRERREDLPLLAAALLRRIAREPGMREARLGRAALGLILDHDWPGNVRELEQALRRAVLLAEGDEIGPPDLGLSASREGRREALRRFDEGLVRGALRAADGNRTAAARALGVSRVTLHRWIKRHGL